MSDRVPWGAVLLLGLTQNIGYGTLYYSFSILAPDMSEDFGLSPEAIFGALSIALLAGGLTAPLLGAWIDRIGAGRIMTFGSLVAAAALAACALAPSRAPFAVALVVLECAANLVQYGAAFALLVQIRPGAAQRSITYLTLIAGFASTIFWPVTTWLHSMLTWQEVYLVYATVNLLICMPIHFHLSNGSKPPRQQNAENSPHAIVGIIPSERRRIAFALMVMGLSIQSLLSSAMLVHMVPILSGLGLGASAALVGSLFGPSQVLSRFINMVLGGNLPPLTLAIIAATLMPVAVTVLAMSPSSIGGAVTFAVLFGLGNGLFSIVTGTLPLALFGSAGYGRLQGKLMAARLIVSASAPFALASSVGLLGVETSLVVTATVGFVAIGALVAIGRLNAGGCST